MYRWAGDRNIPAENIFPERTSRALAVARKVSFGSQSDAGAGTREILMSIVLTVKQRFEDFPAPLKNALDHVAQNANLDPHSLLFRQNPS
jgi:hypothetical protein